MWPARSPRRARLPADWAKLRKAILRRDPYCMIADYGCEGMSTQVDHIAAGDDHRPENLQGACRSCHAGKSAREGAVAARRRRMAELPRHPGLIS